MSPAIGPWPSAIPGSIPLTGLLLLEPSGLDRDRCWRCWRSRWRSSPPRCPPAAPRAPSKLRARPAAPSARAASGVASSGGAGVWAQFLVRTRLRDARHPAQLDLLGPACAGGRRVRSRADDPRRIFRHAAAAGHPRGRRVAGAGAAIRLLLIAGGPVRRRARLARAGRPGSPRSSTRRRRRALSFWLAKLVAVVLMLLAMLGVGNGRRDRLSARQWRHPHRFPLLSCRCLFVLLGLPMLMFGVLAIFVQTLVNQKYHRPPDYPDPGDRGPARRPRWLEVRVPLLHFATYPDVPLSDMNRYGHFLPARFWFLAYWACVDACSSASPPTRFGSAAFRLALDAAARACGRDHAGRDRGRASLAVVGTAAAGSSSIGTPASSIDISAVRSSSAAQRRLREGLPPVRGAAAAPHHRGRDGGRSLSGRPALPVARPLHAGEPQRRADRDRPRAVQLLMSRSTRSSSADADLVARSRGFNHFVFRRRTPLAPGESRTLTFDRPSEQAAASRTAPRSRRSSTTAPSRTTRYLAPSIGVQRSFICRRTSSAGALMGSSRSRPGRRSTTRRSAASTSSRPTPISSAFRSPSRPAPTRLRSRPGYLEREWSAGGRRFFRYEHGPRRS